MISWCRSISLRCRSIRLGLRVDWDTLVGNISNISVVVVSGVLDVLGTAIRKSNSVRSRNNTISVRGFSGIESSLGVIISNSVLISVGLRGSLLLNIRGRLVSWGRGMVGRGSYLDNRGSMDNGGMVGRGSMDNWGSVDNRGMISWGRGMVGRGSMDNGGMISWGSVVNRGGSITLLNWESSWSNISSRSLLIATIAMYRLRSSVGLAHNRSMYSSMGLVDRVAHSRGIALLDALVVGLVSGNYGQKCGTDKSLKKENWKFHCEFFSRCLLSLPSCCSSDACVGMIVVYSPGTSIYILHLPALEPVLLWAATVHRKPSGSCQW